jgi:hypothetical protein
VVDVVWRYWHVVKEQLFAGFVVKVGVARIHNSLVHEEYVPIFPWNSRLGGEYPAAEAREITERPDAPSGVVAFMSAHSKNPYITPSMDCSSGKGVVRGRRDYSYWGGGGVKN